ncbi:MAG: hypothetical protein QOK29_3711 [Rhodospirillaceae bacterium]|nr:hypothetical protein [Rhodospirillaceae bacterium]
MNTIITAAILGSFVTLTVNVAAIAQSITATPGTFEITPMPIARRSSSRSTAWSLMLLTNGSEWRSS